jgi:hypothetical protein
MGPRLLAVALAVPGLGALFAAGAYGAPRAGPPITARAITGLSVTVGEQSTDSSDPGSTFRGTSSLSYRLTKVTPFQLGTRKVVVSLPIEGGGSVSADYTRLPPIQGDPGEHESCSSAPVLPSSSRLAVTLTPAGSNVRVGFALIDLPVPLIGGTGDNTTGVPCYPTDASAFGTAGESYVVPSARLGARKVTLTFTGKGASGASNGTRNWTIRITFAGS